MKEHLTEEILIKYEFKLLAEDEMAQVAEHLTGCEACRRQHERVQGKFASLEALRAEPKASEALIARTLQQVKQTKTARKVPFYRQGWLQVAAAVLVVGGLAFSLWRMEPVEPVMPGERRGEEKFVADSDGGKKELIEAETVLAEQPTVAVEAAPQPRVGTVAAVVTEEFIPDEPPFAPASNIELTVLPRRENVQLTIYNSADLTLAEKQLPSGGLMAGGQGVFLPELDTDPRYKGLTLVRDKRNLTMKRGWNWLQFSWEGTLIDPTSLSLEPKEQADKITVEQLVFPPRQKNLGRWLIKSEVSGQVDFEITYLTSGINWRAFYMGTLSQDEATMRLQGYVRVNNNSGEDYEDAQTRLLVGQVHLLDEIAMLARREQPYGSPISKRGEHDYAFEDSKVPIFGDMPLLGTLYGIHRKEIIKEGLSEYFLYTIEGTETIEDEWGKRLPSFEVDEIPVESLYKYDEEQWARQTMRFVTFANDAEHELGQTPIPDGSVKIYGAVDAEGHLRYVGGTNIKYIPVNEEVELNLGAAQEVKVEPVLMESRTENYEYKVITDLQVANSSLNIEQEISGWEKVQTWQVKVTNTRAVPVDVEITRYFQTNYWDMETVAGDVTAEKHDAGRERFEMRVEPRSEQVFTYMVRLYYGTRERFSRELEVENIN